MLFFNGIMDYVKKKKKEKKRQQNPEQKCYISKA